MITKEDLRKDLSDLGINPKGTLLVHSSYKKIGDVEGRGDTVIDVLLEYMKEGTLILPTHTWDQIAIDKQPVMEVEHTASCIGILPDIFRQRPDVIRTWHPTHSVGIYGEKAQDLAKGEEFINTPCGPGSIWNKLLDEKASILLVGVDFTRNTFIHCIEELCDVPNRLTEEIHDLYVITPHGEKLYTPQYRHRKGLGSQTFWKLEALMEKEGVMKKGQFGQAQTMLCDAQGLYRILSQMLSKDIEILSDNEPLEPFWYEMNFK
ncbi:MAG TPA: AAC(3) family N-acetyltransferase [Candidatus Merdenecus merdavium]|nr:AAC(3) family N-acetyltransferase [Candidatus Merdenecus merdavium]